MIKIKIWTHIGHPSVKVDRPTLDRMQIGALAKSAGRYRVTWCTGEERVMIINWNNVIMLEYPMQPMPKERKAKSTVSSKAYVITHNDM